MNTGQWIAAGALAWLGAACVFAVGWGAFCDWRDRERRRRRGGYVGNGGSS